jgi:hypothetical protein
MAGAGDGGSVYYNVTFVQFQGDTYLALICAARGARRVGWAMIAVAGMADRVGPALAVAWMPMFAVYALYRYVIRS